MPKKSSVSRSKRAGLVFPVGRIGRHLRSGQFAPRVSQDAPIYLAAVMQYVISEALEMAGNSAKDDKKVRITPRHIQMALGGDDDLSTTFQNAALPEGGVIPFIHKELLPPKKKGSSSA